MKKLITIIAFTFLLLACDMFQVDVIEYLDYYTNTAGIEELTYDGNYPVDSSGIINIPSGADRVLTFTLRNPQEYDLNVFFEGTSLSSGDYTLAQSPTNKSLITLSFTEGKISEWDASGGKDISSTVRIQDRASERVFDPYTYSAVINSPPPTPKKVMLGKNEDNSGNTGWYLAFDVASLIDRQGSAGDITYIKIGNVTYPISIDDDGDIDLSNAHGLSDEYPISEPSLLLESNTGLAFEESADGSSIYFNTNVHASQSPSYTVSFIDARGLESEIVFVSAIGQVRSNYYVQEGAVDGTGTASKPFSNVQDVVAAIKLQEEDIPAGTAYTIHIQGDITEEGSNISSDSMVVIDEPLNITLQGWGGTADDNKINANSTKRVLYISGSGANVTLGENLTLTGGDEVDGGGVYVASGKLTLDGAVISGNTASGVGGGAYIGVDATFIMNDGAIGGATADKNEADEGGGVYINSATFEMNGGSILGNTASKATNGGGAGVYITDSSTFTMKSGARIERNVAVQDGGGVYMRVNSTFTMFEGAIITDNQASAGAGVYSPRYAETTFTMHGGEVSHNIQGGGVFIGENSTFIMKDGTINNNTKILYAGAGVYLQGSGSTMTMSGGEVINNEANETATGGGIYLKNGSSLSLSGAVKITGNTQIGDDSNIRMEDESAVSVNGALTSSADSIGITPSSSEAGTLVVTGNGYINGSNKDAFISDTDSAILLFNNNIVIGVDEVFISGSSSADGDGLTSSTPMKVNSQADFEKAKEKFTSDEGTVWIVDAVSISSGIHTFDGENNTVMVKRHNTNTSALINVTGGELSLQNITLDGQGNVNSLEGGVTSSSAAVVVSSGAELILKNGTVLQNNKNSGDGGAIYSNGTVTLPENTTAKIISNTALLGSALYIQGGSLSMADGIIGGSINDKNNATGYAAVYINSGADFTMSSGEISYNENIAGFGTGGGVYLAGSFEMSGDAKINYNKANFYDGGWPRGGGVCIFGGEFIMYNGDINNNYTRGDGGGVFIHDSGSFHMINGNIKYNESGKEDGAGVAIAEDKVGKFGTFTMDGGEISGNRAFRHGGGVSIKGSRSTFIMNGGSITSNTATNNVGGVFVFQGTVTMTSGSITNNMTENTNGGGVYVASAGTLNLKGNPVITNNGAKGSIDASTGIWSAGADGSLNNVYFFSELNSSRIKLTGALEEKDNIKPNIGLSPSETIANYMLVMGEGHAFTTDDFSMDDEVTGKIIGGNNLRVFGNADIIYLNGATGNNDNLGNISGYPVKTFDVAVARLRDGGTILINGTVPINDSVTWKKPDAWTNNLIVKRNEGFLDALLHVPSSGNLFLENIIIDGQGNINSLGGSVNANNSLVTVASGATLTLNTGVILQNNNNVGSNAINRGGAITSQGTVNVNEGSKIQYNISDPNNSDIEKEQGRGGGIYATGGIINMDTGSEIKYNSAKDWKASGGGVHLENTIFNFYGGTISYNTLIQGNNNGSTEQQGAGIFVGFGATLNMSGENTIVTRNEADEGGGVYIEGGKLAMRSGIIDNNSASHGGGIYASGGTITLGIIDASNDDVVISNHNITNNGGGVYLKDGAILTMNSGTIKKNTASSGAGIYVTGKYTSSDGLVVVPSTFTMKGGLIGGDDEMDENSAANFGGGVYVNEDGDFEMSGSASISNNLSSRFGGGVSVAGIFDMAGSASITHNHTPVGGGGGVYISENGSFDMSGSASIAYNFTESTGDGGGVLVDGALSMDGSASIKNNFITTEVDTACGGGMHVGSKGKLDLKGTPVIKDNMVRKSGADIISNVYLFKTTTNSSQIKLIGDLKSDSNGVEPSIGLNTSTNTIGHMLVENKDAYDFDTSYFTMDNSAYGILKQGNNLHIVVVASVDGTNYGTFTEAWAAAKGSTFEKTVKLLTDIKITEKIMVEANDNIKLDLNGYTIDAGARFTFVNGGTATITDPGIEDGVIRVEGGGKLTLTDTSPGGSGVITGGNNPSKSGGGVSVSGSTFTMSGGTIKGNLAGTYDYGGGVYLYKSTFTMSGGTISGNNSSKGGGVYVDSNSNFTMSRGTISGNSGAYGGGVAVFTNSIFNMNGGTISANRGYNNTGGVYINSGTFNLSGSVEIKDNASTGKIESDGSISGGTSNNVFWGTYGSIKVTGSLTVESAIGLTPPDYADDSVIVTAGGTYTGALDSTWFKLDDEDASYDLESDNSVSPKVIKLKAK